MKTNRILLASPVSRSKNYCMHEFLWNIAKMESVDKFLLINNSDVEYGNYLAAKLREMYLDQKITVVNIMFDNEASLAERVTKSMNYAREVLLNGEFTHLFVVECDLFPEKTALKELLFHDKPVVGFPYFIGLGINSYLCLQHTRTRLINLDHVSYLNSVVHPFDSFMLMNGKLTLVHGVGLGCALMKTEVLERIPFSHADDAFHDTVFYKDCFDKQVQVFCDTSKIIQHKNQSWAHITKIYN